MPETSLKPVSVDAIESDAIDPRSNLADLKRKICVVTTAALPWRTGTSVNPLARALYLTRGRLRNKVTLVLPWLPKKEEQAHLFGDHTFETEKDQEAWIREYCRNRMGCEEEEFMLRIIFYEAYYNAAFGSIFPAVDICSVIPDEDADIAILEEPEHLTWLRVPVEVEDGDEDATSKALLGWKFKFKYVVGILHTNYEMYIKQYGIGTSFIAAPVLSSLSSLVVQAYCHRVVRLSATLPHLDPSREKTCNVHGVRSEFFESPSEEYKPTIDPVPVYFIGKLVWAKGFDKLLDMADAFKRSTGEYFPIDIYGSGKEEESIRRAFLGRKGVIKTEDASEKFIETPADLSIKDFFSAEGSLRELVVRNEPVQEALSDGMKTTEIPGPNPLDIISDISGRSMMTGVSATAAVANLCKRSVELGFHSTFSEKLENDSESKGYHLDLPRSKYELRKHPIPARFLGLIDHVVIRDMPKYKIFLNLSESEVLCTTTAEALAMGKWVVIPNHPSNEFFLEFPNCLAFSDESECIEKIKHALANDPRPLSEMDKMKLSWEGAIQRLFDSTIMSTAEFEERDISAEKDVVALHTQWTKSLRTVQSTVVKTAGMLTQR